MAAILDFPSLAIRTFFSIFDLQVTPKHPTPIRVNWPFGSGEVKTLDFQDGCQPSGISNPKDFTFFFFWSTSHLDASYHVSYVNQPFSSGEEAKKKKRFLRWPPSWISDWSKFCYFWFTSHPNASYQVLSQLQFLLEIYRACLTFFNKNSVEKGA